MLVRMRTSSFVGFVVFFACAGVWCTQVAAQESYLRGPMPVSGVRAMERAPLRVAQVDPSFLPPNPVQSLPNNGAFGQPFQPLQSGSYGIPPQRLPPSNIPPNYLPQYSNPNYAAPNNIPPNYAPPNYEPPNYEPGYGNGSATQFGVPSDNFFRSPTLDQSPFGRQPLSPYAETDFNAQPVDADLIVGLTPSSQTLNYGAGVGFNSDLGVFGQFVYDDRDFDLFAPPWRNPPVPFRGGGQHLRIEATPGVEAQRYLVSFTEPYFGRFGGQPVALNLSGFYFERDYFDWDERRYGGRVGLGYYLSRQLALNLKFRIENVDVSRPRILVPELQRSLGDSELYGAGLSLAYDTRDNPYTPTEGGYFSAGFEQVFGTFDYPRGTVSLKQYAWIRQRPDYSGRHVLGLHFDGGITGSQTPIYENFFAGGFSTLRGFRFRHASPKDSGVIVGGELSLLGSAEYFFPITADDMVRGVLFTDFGTVEETTDIDADDFRLSVGGGLRVVVPAFGPVPLSVDFAVPLLRADTDRIQNIAFYLSLGR